MSAGVPMRGFTLIEVLVALAIVAVGMAALFNATNQTVRTSSYLREKTLAQWIALNKLTETRVEGVIPAQDRSEGELEYANRKWRWELEKIRTPVEGIVRLESRVAREEARDGSWTAQATGFMGTSIAPPTGTGLKWAGDPNQPGGQQRGGDEPPGTPTPVTPPQEGAPPEEPPADPPVDPEQPQQ